MKTEYRRLGDYIRQVDVRNKEQKVSRLVGLTIDKAFIPSVANTIGTDISNYKIIRKKQFACSLMQVSRDGKMPVAMFEEKEAIMSPAYPMFEVHSSDLLPDYLMLWFLRPEFDREASFYAVGGVRGSLEWNDFCDMMLPVPPIEEQRRIVEQYQTVERRIKNNERLIALLEDTAQTIFRHRFVDNIDPNNLPKGWRMGHINDIATLKVGGDKPNVFSETKTSECKVPIYSNGIDEKGIYGFTNEATISEESVTISARGTIGYCFLRFEPYVPIVRLISAIPYNWKSLYFVYFLLKMQNIKGDGSVQNQLTVPFLNTEDFVIAPISEQENYYNDVNPVFQHIRTVEMEQTLLSQVKELLISKL